MVLASKLRSWFAGQRRSENSAATAPSTELLERTLRQFDLQQSLTTESEAATLVRRDPNDVHACCVLGYAALAHGRYDHDDDERVGGLSNHPLVFDGALHVIGEEDGGLGAFATLRRGHRGEAAVITEPTSARIVTATAGGFRIAVAFLGATAAALGAYFAFDRYTRWGLAMQATAADEEATLTRYIERRVALFAHLHVNKGAALEMYRLPIQTGGYLSFARNTILAR